MKKFAVLLVAAALSGLVAFGQERPTGGKDKAITFLVGSSAEKAQVTEVRDVGGALWVRIDVTRTDDSGLAVVSELKVDTTARTGLALDGDRVKYLVFGPAWAKEEGAKVIFMRGLPRSARDAIDSQYAAGKVVWRAAR